MTLKKPNRFHTYCRCLGPTQNMFNFPDVNNPGFRNISFDELCEDYEVSINALIKGNVDLIMIETVFDITKCQSCINGNKKC